MQLGDGMQAEVIRAERSFLQAGLMIDGEHPEALEYRVFMETRWSDWTPVQVTWSEGAHHVARLFVDSPSDRIEFRGQERLDKVWVELFEHPVGALVLAKELPYEEPDEKTTKRGLAPSSLVVSRSEWGARNPGKICGGVVQPYRLSIHHTVSPSNDGADPAARLRQMQAYHIDVNGWCDIGYHFIVSQSGQIFQGRSDERRPGAHVVNQNAGNIGVSLIGNFEVQTPGEAQLDATVRIMRWVRQTYGITWDTSRIKGHRQWPGQSTACPGSRLLSRIPALIEASRRDGEAPPSSLSPIEVYWARQTDGRYALRALAPPAISRVEYFVDDWRIAQADRSSASNFPASYTFTSARNERRFKVLGFDAAGQLAGQGVGLLDVTEGVGVYIRQMGEDLYEIGLERAPAQVAALRVEVDGRWALTDSVSGQVRSPRGAVRSTFSQLGSRDFKLTTFNADGTVRGSLYRTFELR